LGEHLPCKQEVVGSMPIDSTNHKHGDCMRLVRIRKPIVNYVTEQVDLIPHLKRINVSCYYSRETKSIEIRVPTQWEGCTNYIGNIPLYDVDHLTKEEIWDVIYGPEMFNFLEEYEDCILWDGDK
jgi:hypothetical protein